LPLAFFEFVIVLDVTFGFAGPAGTSFVTISFAAVAEVLKTSFAGIVIVVAGIPGIEGFGFWRFGGVFGGVPNSGELGPNNGGSTTVSLILLLGTSSCLIPLRS